MDPSEGIPSPESLMADALAWAESPDEEPTPEPTPAADKAPPEPDLEAKGDDKPAPGEPEIKGNTKEQEVESEEELSPFAALEAKAREQAEKYPPKPAEPEPAAAPWDKLTEALVSNQAGSKQVETAQASLAALEKGDLRTLAKLQGWDDAKAASVFGELVANSADPTRAQSRTDSESSVEALRKEFSDKFENWTKGQQEAAQKAQQQEFAKNLNAEVSGLTADKEVRPLLSRFDEGSRMQYAYNAEQRLLQATGQQPTGREIADLAERQLEYERKILLADIGPSPGDKSADTANPDGKASSEARTLTNVDVSQHAHADEIDTMSEEARIASAVELVSRDMAREANLK